MTVDAVNTGLVMRLTWSTYNNNHCCNSTIYFGCKAFLMVHFIWVKTVSRFIKLPGTKIGILIHFQYLPVINSPACCCLSKILPISIRQQHIRLIIKMRSFFITGSFNERCHGLPAAHGLRAFGIFNKQYLNCSE